MIKMGLIKIMEALVWYFLGFCYKTKYILQVMRFTVECTSNQN